MTERFTKPWKKLVKQWKRHTPPGRPSLKDVAVYRKFLKTVKTNKPKVLVLGATSELRDLLFRLGFTVTVIDLNWDMIMATSSLLKQKNSNEVIIMANWLNMPLKSNYYDAIVGDIVLQNLSDHDQNKFLSEIKRLLKPKGVFISRLYLVPDNWQFKTIDQILAAYASFPYFKNEAMELYSYMVNSVWDPKSKIIDCKKIKKSLKKYWQKDRYKYSNKHLEKALNEMWAVWRPLEKKYSTDWEKNVTKKIKKDFRIIKKEIIKNSKLKELNRCFPIWLAQVKK